MEAISQGTTHSLGPTNQIFSLLLQTILQTQCSISPPDLWPKDFKPYALENSKFHTRAVLFKKNHSYY